MRQRIAAAGRIVVNTVAGFQTNQGSLMAAGLAYYLLISASPLVIVAVAVASAILGTELAQTTARERLEALLGPDAAGTALELLQDVELFSGGIVASLIALAVLFYGSTRAFAALQGSLDVIWDCPPSPTIRHGVLLVLRSRLLAFVMVIGVGILMLTTTAIQTAGASIERLLERYTSLDPEFGSFGNSVAMLVVRTLCLAAVYHALPSRRIAWRDVWPAALFTVVLLRFGHTLIRLYVIHGVGSAYTAAGSVIVLLFSFYFAAFVILLGAQFAKALSDHRRDARAAR